MTSPAIAINALHPTTTATTTMVVNIIGAGIAGLTLARCLRNLGVKSVVVYEGKRGPARHEYGIVLGGRAWREVWGVVKSEEGVEGVEGAEAVRRRLMVTGFGGGDDGGSVRVGCGRFEALLREKLDIRFNHKLTSITFPSITSPSPHNPNSHTLLFDNEQTIQSTCTIDTSGVHSYLRHTLLPTSVPAVLPFVVFRGTRKLLEWNASWQKYFEGGEVIEWRKNDVLLQIRLESSVKGTDVDVSYIYSRPARLSRLGVSSEADPLYVPNRGTGEASQVPEPLFTEISELGPLPSPFDIIFEVGTMRKDRILNWLMRRLVVPKDKLVELAREKGVWMIGDSAHAMPILGGEGASVAVGDAVELAEMIAGVVKGEEREGNEAAERFYSERVPVWEEASRESERRLVEMHLVDREGEGKGGSVL